MVMVAQVVALALGAAPALAQQAEPWRTDFARHTVPLEEIVSGGPPKDGIPALDNPRFTSVAEADSWLSARDPVVLVEQGDEAKAYPLQILIWHEIVNDVVDGRPLAVTFCPLCNTALAFDRGSTEARSTSERQAGCVTPISSCTTGRRRAGGNRPPAKGSLALMRVVGSSSSVRRW
jgi:hypothetical protein